MNKIWFKTLQDICKSSSQNGLLPSWVKDIKGEGRKEGRREEGKRGAGEVTAMKRGRDATYDKDTAKIIPLM